MSKLSKHSISSKNHSSKKKTVNQQASIEQTESNVSKTIVTSEGAVITDATEEQSAEKLSLIGLLTSIKPILYKTVGSVRYLRCTANSLIAIAKT